MQSCMTTGGTSHFILTLNFIYQIMVKQGPKSYSWHGYRPITYSSSSISITRIENNDGLALVIFFLKKTTYN